MSFLYKKNNQIVIIVFLLLIVVFLLFLIARNHFYRQKVVVFEQGLIAVDRLIASGSYAQAFRQNESLAGDVVSADHYLSLLKRSELIGRTAPEIGRAGFIYMADRAAEQYPDSSDLQAVYVYSLLLGDNYQKAWQEADRRLREERFNDLLLTAWLRFGDQTSLAAPAVIADDLFLAAAEADEPQIFLQIGEQTGRSEFYLNAALLALKKGNIKQAAEIRAVGFPDQYSRFSLLLAYDYGQSKEAAVLIDNLLSQGKLDPQSALLKGDLLLGQGEVSAALSYYTGFIAQYPDYSWLPYFNAAWAAGSSQEAADILQSGLAVFPDQEDLLIALSVNLLKSGRRNSAVGNMEKTLTLYPDSNRAKLVWLQALSEDNSENYLIGQLWNLVNREPDNSRINRYFAYRLLKSGDYAGLEFLLNQYTSSTGENAWALHLHGLSRAMQSDFDGAEERISRAINLDNGDYRYYYNLAAVYQRQNRPIKALPLLEEAERLIRASDAYNILAMARVLIDQGICHDLNRDTTKALEMLRLGLELDPGNLRGLRYLRQINQK